MIFNNGSVPTSCCIHPEDDRCNTTDPDSDTLHQAVSKPVCVCVCVCVCSFIIGCVVRNLLIKSSHFYRGHVIKQSNFLIVLEPPSNGSSCNACLQGCAKKLIDGFKNNLGAIAGGVIVLGLIQVSGYCIE